MEWNAAFLDVRIVKVDLIRLGNKVFRFILEMFGCVGGRVCEFFFLWFFMEINARVFQL